MLQGRAGRENSLSGQKACLAKFSTWDGVQSLPKPMNGGVKVIKTDFEITITEKNKLFSFVVCCV